MPGLLLDADDHELGRLLSGAKPASILTMPCLINFYRDAVTSGAGVMAAFEFSVQLPLLQDMQLALASAKNWRRRESCVLRF